VGAILYFAACLVLAFLGRHRILRWWGTLILSILLTPIVMAVVLLLTAHRAWGWRRQPDETV
jgi:hypothetical protein